MLSRHEFATTRAAQAVVMDWCYGFYNHTRRHSSAGGLSPINYERSQAVSEEPLPRHTAHGLPTVGSGVAIATPPVDNPTVATA